VGVEVGGEAFVVLLVVGRIVVIGEGEPVMEAMSSVESSTPPSLQVAIYLLRVACSAGS
jgi:hypothetical protein